MATNMLQVSAEFLTPLLILCIVPSLSSMSKVPDFLVSNVSSKPVGFLEALEIQRGQNEKNASITPYK